MQTRDYIVKQLARTKSKKYEQYVVTRIVHLLNEPEVKIVTQQYVSRPIGRAQTDLFFPQLKLHIEVLEGHHKNQINDDDIREADIVDATNHEIKNVDVTVGIKEINDRIEDILLYIREQLRSQRLSGSFKPWDIETEFNPDTYIAAGFVDVNDNVAFRRSFEAANCFGNNYAGLQRGGAKHPVPDTIIWFPKLFPNGEWDNSISKDENIIIERNEDPTKAREHLKSHLKSMSHTKRVVFAKVKDNLGQVLYRFRGLYEFDTVESKRMESLVWRRIATKVKTYPKPISG
jgi:very-short-patch-repair endonuclease